MITSIMWVKTIVVSIVNDGFRNRTDNCDVIVHHLMTNLMASSRSLWGIIKTEATYAAVIWEVTRARQEERSVIFELDGST